MQSSFYRLIHESMVLKKKGLLEKQNIAGVIFSRGIQKNPKYMLVGSGRMQTELVRTLQSVGYDVEFAGQEDKIFTRRLLRANVIVGLSPGIVKLPRQIHALKLLYTCNTHVKERLKRLQATSKKWHLPIDEDSSEEIYLKAYERADYFLIAENAEGINNFIKHGIDPAKIKKYHNCCDTDIWVPSDVKRSKFTFVCWSSSFGLRKGLPSLLKAWEQWYSGQIAELHLIGMPTKTSDLLLHGKRKGEVKPGLFLHLDSYPAQYQPVVDFISRSHIAVYPTLEDAMPSALQEMTACGLPVITTKESGCGFTKEFCQYVQPDSTESIAEGLEYWFAKRESLQGPALAAREYMLKNHSWSHFRTRFAEIMKEVAPGGYAEDIDR